MEWCCLLLAYGGIRSRYYYAVVSAESEVEPQAAKNNELNESFMKAYSGRGKWLVSYYESKPQYLGPIPSCPVVSKWSATLDGGENIPIDGSHREIHKFESRDDPVYKKLMEKLLALAKGFPNPTREQKASLADRECEQSFLAKLQDAGGAACRQGEEDTVCVKGTREKLPREILDWVESTKPNDRVFWLEGKAGTGKSTIARTVADSAKSRLTVGRFLFQRGKGDLSRAKYFVTTNARQLAGQHNLQSVIADAVAGTFDIVEEPVDDQWSKLI
ncbi:hypothetical protein BKA80DRAFT_303470 [Phyllosticta citrichinensis]